MASDELRVGFVGLGIMGGAMAMNVRKAGFPLTVHNRTAGKTGPLEQAGAKVADSPAAVAAASDVIVSCVTASQDVLEVVLDADRGILAGVGKGATVIDCSTVAPPVARQCADALANKGAGFLDAPISGGDVGARNATLSIMVGGEKAHFDRALPVLDAMGGTITYCGPSGSGYVVKLCNQICGGLHILAASEALALASAAGIEPSAVIRALSSGASGSWVIENLAPRMAAGNYEPGFFVDYQLKDLRLACQAARDAELPLPGAHLAEVLFQAASSQGYGKDSSHALYKVIRNLCGER